MRTGRLIRGRTLILVLMVILAGCGGGGDPVSPPGPPTPPQPGVATSLAVLAGEGQQAEPGSMVPVKPMIIVKDAAGRGVAGVSVAFAIDSGGGTLQTTSASTALDGTASPGDWRLGPAEGRNVVRVTAGSLTPAKLVATSVIERGC